ncbi:uncharacterized protein VICG_02169, partial [Vittaforma corneae ATCC 50505]
SNNEFEIFPAVIGKLKNLQYLNLSNNKLKSLPGEMGELKNLKILYLNGNKLMTLPVEIKKLSDSLQLLDLRGGNSISEVGDEEKTLGKKELKEIFRHCVRFDGDVWQRSQ